MLFHYEIAVILSTSKQPTMQPQPIGLPVADHRYNLSIGYSVLSFAYHCDSFLQSLRKRPGEYNCLNIQFGFDSTTVDDHRSMFCDIFSHQQIIEVIVALRDFLFRK